MGIQLRAKKIEEKGDRESLKHNPNPLPGVRAKKKKKEVTIEEMLEEIIDRAPVA